MRILLALATTCALLISRTGLAEQFHSADVDDLRTVANIVTGLDVSTSMDVREIEIQIEGMAMARRLKSSPQSQVGDTSE